MKKILFLLVIILISNTRTIAQRYETSTIDFDLPNRIAAIRISNLGDSPVEIYANADKSKFFYQPFLKPQWEEFHSLLTAKCNNQGGQSGEIGIPLKIEFSNKDVEAELRIKLQRLGHTVNSLSTLPYAYYQIFAQLGEREIILNKNELPTFNSGISLSIQTTLPYPFGYYEVVGTCEELNNFYERRMYQNILRGLLFTQGFSFSSDYINAFVELNQNQHVKNELFGDESKENKIITTSESSGGGWKVNLGPFSAGKRKGETVTVAEVKNKRFVTRDFVREVIRENIYSLRLFVQGNPERTKEVVNQFVTILLGSFQEIELEFEKITEETYNLVFGQLLYANIGPVEYKSLLESKPKLTYSSKNEKSATLPKEKKLKDKKDETFTYSNNIKWKWDGESWIPSKVKMYIVSKDALTKQINLEAMYFNEGGKRVTASQFIFPAAWLFENNKEEQNINNFNNPIGSILPFAGDKNAIPFGWMLCDGKYLPIKGNEVLFQTIGYNWGRNEKNNDFRLPNLQGQFLRGVDYSNEIDPDVLKRRNSEEEVGEVGSYQSDGIVKHTHMQTWGQGSGDRNDPHYGNSVAKYYAWNNHKTRENENGIAETRPKNAYVNFIIRVK